MYVKVLCMSCVFLYHNLARGDLGSEVVHSVAWSTENVIADFEVLFVVRRCCSQWCKGGVAQRM